jgi:cell fate regulator YaaT (PSP1 superfamily)
VVRVQFVDDGPYFNSASPLKPILRTASDNDLRETSHVTLDESVRIARGRVEHFKLNMRILKAEGQFGGNKLIIYFSAPGRVDFRDLVKDLASALRARVELKQVGARDEAKLVGGMGICGREYCCSSFLRDFVPVSIKMAKNQNLALNPNKVSGGCGRLLCCLTYENDAYIDLRKRLPPLKSRVRATEEGVSGTVIKTDILNQMVMIETADGRLLPFKAKDLEVLEQSQIRREEDPDMAEAESWGEDLDIGMLMDKTPGAAKPEQKPREEGGGGRSQERGGDQRRQEGPRGPQQNRGPNQQNQNRGPRPDSRGGNNQGGNQGGGKFQKPRGPNDRGGGNNGGNNGGGNGGGGR